MSPHRNEYIFLFGGLHSPLYKIVLPINVAVLISPNSTHSKLCEANREKSQCKTTQRATFRRYKLSTQ